MNDKVMLFDMEERQPDTGRSGGQTWVFTGADSLTVQYSEMWDPALVMHSHPNEQINLVLSGEVLFRVGDSDYELKKGCIIRIPPNQPHGLVEKRGEEDFKVIQLIAPAAEQYVESQRTNNKGHFGWPG